MADNTGSSAATTAAITDLWRETFELSPADVDPDEGFFEAGGTSYQALALTTRITETFGVEIPLVAVFTEGSVANLAAMVDDLRSHALLDELAGLSEEEARQLLAAETAEGDAGK